jgi:hypothetical protein
MSAEQIRSYIVKHRPDLSPERVDELVGERVWAMRTKKSDRRVSFDYVDDDPVTLECRKCGAKSRVNRKTIAIAIEKAKLSGDDVYVSPRGQMVGRPSRMKSGAAQLKGPLKPSTNESQWCGGLAESNSISPCPGERGPNEQGRWQGRR